MLAGKHEKCGQCMYTVPEGAHVCGMCGAVREEFNDQSVEVKILSGILGLILGAVIGLISKGLLGQMNVQTPFLYLLAFWLPTIGLAIIGWICSLNKIRWRR